MALIEIGWGQTGAVALGAASTLMGIGSAWLSIRNYKMKRKIEDIPTSKVRSIAIGLVEVKGKVVARETIASPYTHTQCVFYDYRIEERRTSMHKDHKGRTRKETKWVVVHRETDSRSFFIEDDTGKALIDPKGAEIPDAHEEERGTGVQRHIEKLILPGSEVFVIATAAAGTEGMKLGKGEIEKEFLISGQSEKRNVARYQLNFVVLLIAAVILIAFGVSALFFKCGTESFLMKC